MPSACIATLTTTKYHMNNATGNYSHPDQDKKDVSIIIVNYNTRDLLSDCIASILEKTKGVDYEVIVVDNDSHDGSLTMLRERYPEVKAIEAGSNLGFGRANNLGMSNAVGKYLFLLNSDTILLNDAVSEFYRQAEEMAARGENPGVLGAILLGKDRKPCHSFGRFITPASELREVTAKYLRFLKDPENTSPRPVAGLRNVDYVTGADMFLPKKVFEATGGFDPDFFMYCEEVDWQKRMSLLGYSRIIVAGPEIIHLEGGSEKGQKKNWSPGRLANLYRSRKLYRTKHYDRKILPLFRVLHSVLDLPSIALTAIINRQKEYLQLIKLK